MKSSKPSKKNGGFTLAELMLVLMIMAIMITLIVVSGRGIVTYVNETLTKSEGRQYMSYAQVVFDRNYNSDETVNLSIDSEDTSGLFGQFLEMCDGKFNSSSSISATADGNGVITSFEYMNGNRDITVYLDSETETIEVLSGAGGNPETSPAASPGA